MNCKTCGQKLKRSWGIIQPCNNPKCQDYYVNNMGVNGVVGFAKAVAGKKKPGTFLYESPDTAHIKSLPECSTGTPMPKCKPPKEKPTMDGTLVWLEKTPGHEKWMEVESPEEYIETCEKEEDDEEDDFVDLESSVQAMRIGHSDIVIKSTGEQLKEGDLVVINPMTGIIEKSPVEYGAFDGRWIGGEWRVEHGMHQK